MHIATMTTENIVSIIKSLGNADNLEIFEMLMKGPVCGCKIGEKFGLDNAGVTAKVAPIVESGIVIETKDLEWNKYRIGETNMCLLNKYFNDQIDACRSTSCKCKCGDSCC